MSGAGTWIPCNHHARAAGLSDSPEEVLAYLRAGSAPGWAEKEEPLWRAFVEHAPKMLEFIERHTPLRFALVEEPDPQAEQPGGKRRGRMLSPRPLSRRLLGPLAPKLRRSTLPHRFTYQEMVGEDPYGSPVRAALRLWPRLLSRILTDSAGQGNALMIGMIRGALDKGCRLELETRVVELVVVPACGRVEGVEVEERKRERLDRAPRRGAGDGRVRMGSRALEKNFPGCHGHDWQPAHQYRRRPEDGREDRRCDRAHGPGERLSAAAGDLRRASRTACPPHFRRIRMRSWSTATAAASSANTITTSARRSTAATPRPADRCTCRAGSLPMRASSRRR